MTDNQTSCNDLGIKTPPRGLAILALVGPSFVWAAEFIGSGEVILATRTGAILLFGYVCFYQIPVTLVSLFGSR
jgi:hypothetical protein